MAVTHKTCQQPSHVGKSCLPCKLREGMDKCEQRTALVLMFGVSSLKAAHVEEFALLRGKATQPDKRPRRRG